MACDTTGKVVLYNKAYSQVDGMAINDVLGYKIPEVYGLDKYGSTLIQVMKSKIPLYAHRQFYTTKFGKKVDAVKDVYPLVDNDKVIGAFALVHDFEKAKTWAKQIMDATLKRNKSKDFENFFNIDEISYKSEGMIRCVEQASLAATRDINICIYSEAGAEKDSLANHIVKNSARKNMPYLVVDCAAIPPDLMSRMFFGYKDIDVQDGKVEQGFLYNANNGTIFLKNMHTIPKTTQAMLANCINTNSYYPVGGMQENIVNIRFVVSLPSRPNSEELKDAIIPELMYCLNNLYIEIPPLCKRIEDVNMLTQYFIKELNSEHKTGANTISNDVFNTFVSYDWPGNIIELKNVIQASIIMCADERQIQVHHLPQYLQDFVSRSSQEDVALRTNDYSLSQALLLTEEQTIIKALDVCAGNITKAAQLLGIGRQNLQYRIKKLNINNSGA